MDQTIGNVDPAERLKRIREEIDLGLDRYLTTRGRERQELTMYLLRLKWAVEELEHQGRP